ncbi:hypothetical protein BD410DRAFT_806660 [Rickenella mellea]|uniref:Uncharacterized protein n=1 Tax=Rickenella mellea TaxID=50990 RepID=A0A4Y7PSG7_9AGAM|nr:hypothetical protein BD410DRAFT_806660 [Rickenella mellea]
MTSFGGYLHVIMGMARADECYDGGRGGLAPRLNITRPNTRLALSKSTLSTSWLPNHIHFLIIPASSSIQLGQPRQPPASLTAQKHNRSSGKMTNIHTHIRPKPNGGEVATTASLANGDANIAPAFLRVLYSINHTYVATSPRVTEPVGDSHVPYSTSCSGEYHSRFHIPRLASRRPCNPTPSQLGPCAVLVFMGGHQLTVQTNSQSFDFDGISDLDLEYAMSLTNPRPFTLLLAGDFFGGAFGNSLDALEQSFCTFEGRYPANGGFQNHALLLSLFRYPMHKMSLAFRLPALSGNATSTARLGWMGTRVPDSSGDDSVSGWWSMWSRECSSHGSSRSHHRFVLCGWRAVGDRFSGVADDNSSSY